MKAKDLMIGNLISSKETSNIQKITGLTDENPFIDSITFDYTNYDEIESIPITLELLDKLGLRIENKPNEDIEFFYKESRFNIVYKTYFNVYYFCFDNIVLKKIKYILEVQNLFYLLADIELKLKND